MFSSLNCLSRRSGCCSLRIHTPPSILHHQNPTTARKHLVLLQQLKPSGNSYHHQQLQRCYSSTYHNPELHPNQRKRRHNENSTNNNQIPEYILPYANQSKLTLYLACGLLFGTLIGFIGRPYLEVYLGSLFHSREDEPGSAGPAGDFNVVERFERFADVVTPDGEKVLSPAAFVDALIGPREPLPSWVALPRDPKTGKLRVTEKLRNSNFLKMVNLADVNHDQLISLDEFVFFHTLVTRTHRQFEVAFKLFDTDGNGQIGFDEFREIMHGASNTKHPLNLSQNGLMIEFFGPNLDQFITFDQFNRFLSQVKKDLLKLEFAQHDLEDDGSINVESFSELMTNSTHFNSLRVPFFKKQLNVLKTNGFFRPSGKIDFETFMAFSQIADELEDIECAIHILDVTKHPINRETFTRALTKVGNITVPQRAVELIFAIFDTDKDGQLDHEEFLRVFSGRSGMGEPHWYAEELKKVEQDEATI